MKAGIKTSEFWVTTLTILFSFFGDKIGVSQSDSAQLASSIAAGVTAVIYVLSRTRVKEVSNGQG